MPISLNRDVAVTERQLEWQRRQERAALNLKAIGFANAVRIRLSENKRLALITQAEAALRKIKVAAPVKVMKGTGPGTFTLAVRVAMAAVRGARTRVLGKVKELPITALVTGAALGEIVSEVFDADLPEAMPEVPPVVKEIIRATGETFGLHMGVQEMMQGLKPRIVAVYLGKRLLAALKVEVAELLLKGMKRNTRDRVRVR